MNKDQQTQAVYYSFSATGTIGLDPNISKLTLSGYIQDVARYPQSAFDKALAEIHKMFPTFECFSKIKGVKTFPKLKQLKKRPKDF